MEEHYSQGYSHSSVFFLLLSFFLSPNKSNQAIQDKASKEISELTSTLRSTKSQLTSVVAEKLQLKRSAETIERSFQAKINDIKAQSAPLERRYQEVTRALVNAKELETAATKESQEQSKIAKDVRLSIFGVFLLLYKRSKPQEKPFHRESSYFF